MFLSRHYGDDSINFDKLKDEGFYLNYTLVKEVMADNNYEYKLSPRQ